MPRDCGYSVKMPYPEENTPSRKWFALSWPVALSALTAIAAAGTAALHLIGEVQHRSYLQYWNVDANFFPKPVDWILINGYYGVFDRMAAILTAVLANLPWLAVATVILGLYLFLLRSSVASGSGEPPTWLLRLPHWGQRLIRQLLLTALFVAAVPLALLLLAIFMAVPALLGEIAGKAAAQREAVEYMKGCQDSKIPCVELRREGEVVATGFVLESSSSHIAVFDAQAQRGRVLALEKLEILSSSAPILQERSTR